LRWHFWLGMGVGVTAGVLTRIGMRNSRRLTVTQHTVFIPELPEAFDGFRLLQLSDLHLPRRDTMGARLLALVAELAPDAVCLTGDYAFTALSLAEVDTFFSQLASFPHVFAIYGNADYRPDITNVARQAWTRYFPFLTNTALSLMRGDQALWIAGVDDPHHGQDNLAAAMAPVPIDAPVILLAHSPEIIQRRLDPRIRLILTGHTHGGQICLPNGIALYNNTTLPALFASGRHRVAQADLYVSRGIGSTRLPLRFGCLPEVSVFTLRRGTTAS